MYDSVMRVVVRIIVLLNFEFVCFLANQNQFLRCFMVYMSSIWSRVMWVRIPSRSHFICGIVMR